MMSKPIGGDMKAATEARGKPAAWPFPIALQFVNERRSFQHWVRGLVMRASRQFLSKIPLSKSRSLTAA